MATDGPFPVGPTHFPTHASSHMTADLKWMEHRWGTRIELDAPAEITTLGGVAVTGVVRNASLSGALASTSFRPALLSRIALKPRTEGGEWLEGCVVRVEGNEVAIEWLDPPLHALAVLLAQQHGPFESDADGPRRAPVSDSVVSLLEWRLAQT